MKKIFTLLLLFMCSYFVQAQTISYATAGSNYSQSFDGLISTGATNNAANGPFEIVSANFAGSNLPGWYTEKYSGTGTGVSFSANDGASNSGSVFSYGTTSATDRALGSLASGSRVNRFGVILTNNTGTTLNLLNISFITEMWRKGNGTVAHVYPFSYKLGATGINDATGFISQTNFDLVTPNTTAPNDLPCDGNLPINRASISNNITSISWAPGQTLALRWDDVNESGNDDGLAIDDFNFSATASVSPVLTATPSSITVPNTTVGNPSAATTYSLSGSNLNGSTVSVTAPANFEVSTDGTNYAVSQNVTYTAPNLSATISVRLTATAPIGSYSAQDIVNSGGGAPTVNVSASGNVFASEPTVQATNVLISAVTNSSFTVNWTNGNGSSRLVSIRTSGAKVPPVDGTSYTIPVSLGSGNLVYYIGAGSGPLNVNGLVPGINYTVQVYEFNGTGAGSNYLDADATGNPASATTLGTAPTLQQSNFTSVATPQYGVSGSSTRLPVMYFATISGLKPNTIYRYVNQAGIDTDLGTSFLGAGNPILIDNTVSPVTYLYSSSPSVSGTNSYGLFETNASGSFTGAFGFVNTGNARFTPGNTIMPTIEVAEDVTYPAAQFRFALNQSITVLSFGTTASTTEGTFIKGLSSATAGNVVGLWSTVDGNLVAQRPLAMTIVEDLVTTGATWPSSFVTGYDESAGAWNTIIPNSNANGVRLIQQFDIATGNVIGCNSDADGIWPSGANTVSPNGGSTTAIQITATDAPINTGSCFSILPVSISNFNVQKAGNTAKIFWTTEQEINSREFVVERSSNQRSWTTVATVNAAGTSTARINYSVIDNAPAKGINFYRLKLVEADNSFDHSATKSLLFGNADVVLVTPNPATTFATIYMGKADNSVTQLIVSDMNGKVVENVRTNDQTYILQTNRYGKGMYVVRVITGSNTSTHKLIVQ